MISVIVPVFNGERTIERCIRSILSQENVNLELLVVDDGSADKTHALCRALAEGDGRIRLFHQENAGVSATRNRGLKEAKGSFVTFVDADDLLPSGALAALSAAGEAKADFVIGSHSRFRGPWKHDVHHNASDPLPSLMSLMCGKLYRRSLLEQAGLRFREDLPYGEDTLFNLQYAAVSAKIQVLSQVVYLCHMGGTASSRRFYPDRDRIALVLVEAYGRFGVDTAPIAAREWEETVLHYFVHCPFAEARNHAARTRATLHPFLPEVPEMEQILRKHWLRLILRRIKIWLGRKIG